jgi:heat shock protein HtpX
MGSARKQRWADDSGLSKRMAATIFMLGLVYVVLMASVIAAGGSLALVFAVSALVVVVQLAFSDRLALRALGAVEATPYREPELHAVVDRLCMQMDMPKPRVAVAQSELANALAVGRTRGGATVCVTRRAMRILDPAELEAVMAHELAHVQNRDALVMTAAAFVSLVASIVVRIGINLNHVAARAIAVAVAIGAYVVSYLLLTALSRYRELAADRTAALVTARPSALASALMKLDDAAARTPREDLRKATPVAALCITAAPARYAFTRILSTHPTTERRIAALARLETRLQRTA